MILNSQFGCENFSSKTSLAAYVGQQLRRGGSGADVAQPEMCQCRSLVSCKHASVNLGFSLRIAQQDRAAKYSSIDLISSAVTPMASPPVLGGRSKWRIINATLSLLEHPSGKPCRWFGCKCSRTYRRRAQTPHQDQGPFQFGTGPVWSDTNAKCESPSVQTGGD